MNGNEKYPYTTTCFFFPSLCPILTVEHHYAEYEKSLRHLPTSNLEARCVSYTGQNSICLNKTMYRCYTLIMRRMFYRDNEMDWQVNEVEGEATTEVL